MQALKELTTAPITAGRLYYSKPDQAFIRALNQAMFAQQTGKGSTLAVVSSSFYAVEILKRTSQKLALAGTESFNPQLFTEHMDKWAIGELIPVDLFTLQEKFNIMVWAEPKHRSANLTIEQITNLAVRGSELIILVTSDFGFLRSSNVIGRKSKERSLIPRAIKVILKENGWQLDSIIGFYGIKAKFWNFLAMKFLQADNLHWSDRCRQMQHLKMREPGWLWPLYHLALIRARWD